MTQRGLYYVASRPVSKEREAEYNTWYEEVHLKEICEIPGFLAARRYAPVTGDGPYVALYDLEGDDLEAVVARLRGRSKSMTASSAVCLDPPPETRLYVLTAEAQAG